jgi:hypothetical protein
MTSALFIALVLAFVAYVAQAGTSITVSLIFKSRLFIFPRQRQDQTSSSDFCLYQHVSPLALLSSSLFKIFYL